MASPGPRRSPPERPTRPVGGAPRAGRRLWASTCCRRSPLPPSPSPSRSSSPTAAPPASATPAPPRPARHRRGTRRDRPGARDAAARWPACRPSSAGGHDAAMALHGRLASPCSSCWSRTACCCSWATPSPTASTSSPRPAIWSQPDLPLAILGFALFLAVVVSLLVAVRRRLRYEAWHLVHLLSYAAVLASLPHQFSVGGLFAEGTWQRGYWMAVTVATLAAVVAFRLVAPIAVTLRHRLAVESVEQVGDPRDGVVSVTMGVGRSTVCGRPAGSSSSGASSRGPGWQAHPLALGGAARRPAPDHGVRTRRRLRRSRERPPRHARRVEGPYGIFSEVSRTRRRSRSWPRARGHPIRSLLESATFRPGEATVVLRTPAAADGWLLDEVRALSRLARRDAHHGARRPRPRLAHGCRGAPGTRPHLAVPAVADSDLYVCGPRGWAEGVIAEAAPRASLPSRSITRASTGETTCDDPGLRGVGRRDPRRMATSVPGTSGTDSMQSTTTPARGIRHRLDRIERRGRRHLRRPRRSPPGGATCRAGHHLGRRHHRRDRAAAHRSRRPVDPDQQPREPVLREAVLQAQSASVSMVSGRPTRAPPTSSRCSAR